MKAIILVRVSTQLQDFEQQKKELIQYAHSKGYNELTFIEDKESAIKLKEEERLGLNKLKELVANDPEIKATFIYECSRLARTERVLHSMKDWFVDHKINLYIYDKKYQLLNPDGTINSETEFLFSIYAYFASSEHKTKTIRTERGKQFAREQGKFAAGKLSFGYTTDKDNNIIVDEEQIKIVKYLVDKYINTDATIGSLGVEMYERGVFGDNKKKSCQSKVRKILVNKNYYGIKDSPLIYPQVLPSEMLNNVNLKLSKALKLPKYTNNTTFAKSLLRWSGNGHIFKADIFSATYSIREPRYLAFDLNFIDSIVWELTKNYFYPFIYAHLKNNKQGEIKQQIKVNDEKLTKINKSLKDLEEKEQRLNDLYFDLKLTKEQYQTKYKLITNEKVVFQRSKETLEENSIRLHNLQESLLNRQEMIDFNKVYDIDDVRKREIIMETINYINVEHIRYNIYRLHFYSSSGFNEPFLIDKKKRKLYFKNDFNRWEEYDYEYTIRYIPRK